MAAAIVGSQLLRGGNVGILWKLPIAGIRMASTTSGYSHIIVGAGSAGCVLANRLSANPQNKVLLLEAGKSDRDHNFWKIHMPAALTYNLMDDKYNWYYYTTAQENMSGRKLYHPRGKVLGGSSSLNAMVYIRGHAFDYDRWAEKEGCNGWAYANCLPYFRLAETFDQGANAYRGDSGPLKVTTGKCDNILHHAFMEAGVQAGYSATDDINGYQQAGFGKFQMTIGDGIRCSTARGYLHPVKNRPNLEYKCGEMVGRVIMDGVRAKGVSTKLLSSSAGEKKLVGEEKRYMCAEEGGMVIVCSGAFNSPHLLMLSGVGPAEELRTHGIKVVLDLPGVGRNLQDHLEFYAQWLCKQPVTLLNQTRPIGMLKTGIQWILTQSGAGASSHLESGAFTSTSPDKKHPDIQWHFLPGLVENHGRSAATFHAFQVHIGTMRPTSRGTVTLKSANPIDLPVVDCSYFSTEEDISDMAVCLDQARDIISQSAFDQFRGKERKPGPDVTAKDDVHNFLKEACESAYHPSCTCKMGPKSDPMAVVDPATMTVWGTENLKVVDASVMPSIASGNLNAPTIMIAEKAADHIMGKQMLQPAFDVPVYERVHGITP